MTQTPWPPPETGFSPKQIVLGLITIFSLQFTMSFFLQTLGIARPRMAADLNGMSLYAWSLSIPSLAAAFIMLLFSKFSDMYGRRLMLLICMILFLAGTIWSALAPTYVILIAGETLSRLGTGLLCRFYTRCWETCLRLWSEANGWAFSAYRKDFWRFWGRR